MASSEDAIRRLAQVSEVHQMARGLGRELSLSRVSCTMQVGYALD